MMLTVALAPRATEMATQTSATVSTTRSDATVMTLAGNPLVSAQELVQKSQATEPASVVAVIALLPLALAPTTSMARSSTRGHPCDTMFMNPKEPSRLKALRKTSMSTAPVSHYAPTVEMLKSTDQRLVTKLANLTCRSTLLISNSRRQR